MPTRGKTKQNKTIEEEFTFEAIVEEFTEAFQRHITLKSRTQKSFDFHLRWNSFMLYIRKLKIIFRWVGQFLDIIQVATQFFEELKTTVLAWQMNSIEQNCSSRSNSKLTYPFYQSPNIPYSSQRSADFVKRSWLRKQKSFWRNLHPFSVPLRCKCSTRSSLRTKSHLFEMQTSVG